MTMRKFYFAIALFLGFGLHTFAQTVNVSGDITTNTTWTADHIYLLDSGFHYVVNNSILTIEPGTLIKSTKGSLVVTRGAKLMAEGTSSRPIVFTSAQPVGNRARADWGGVLLMGKAPINDPAGQRLGEGGIDPVKGLYGGTDVNDNSGSLSYVRIEFAGNAFQPNNETNGLTFGGVGSGTSIHHIQVSFGGDDSFEWFGGTVNAKHLVTFRGQDDEFDTDYGYSGRLQFCVSFRDSSFADVSGSNGFESDNDATGSVNAPLTHAIISNLTIVGPKRDLTTTVNSNYKRAAHLRRSTAECIYNTLLMGYPTGLKLESQNVAANCNTGSLQWKNNILAGCPTTFDTTGLTAIPNFSVLGWYNANGNTTFTNVSDLMLADAYNITSPNWQPMPGSPALSGASFTAPNLNSTFFDVVSYRGAFDGTNDWTACWTNFDPENTDYSTPGIDYMPLAVTASDSLTFCDGGFVDLMATSSATSYLWSNGATTPMINVTSSGIYTVTVSNMSGCRNVSSPLTVTVEAVPVADFINTGIFPTVAFNSLAFGSTSWMWDFGDSTTSTISNPVHNYTSEGNKTVCFIAWNANGCSDTICKGVGVYTGIENALQGQVRLYPNPATNVAQVEVVMESGAEATVTLFSLTGQRLLNVNTAFTSGLNRLELNLATVPAGMYMVRVIAENGVKSLPLVIMK